MEQIFTLFQVNKNKISPSTTLFQCEYQAKKPNIIACQCFQHHRHSFSLDSETVSSLAV